MRTLRQIPARRRRGLTLATAALGAALAGLVAPAAAAAERVSAEWMWDLARVSAPALAPDGRSAVVRVARYDKASDARQVDLWLVSTETGRAVQLTHDPGAETEPLWSPDGRALAFIAQRGDDAAHQVYVLSESAPPQRLTTAPGGVETIRWLPDGSGLVFVSRIWEDLKSPEAQAARAAERAQARTTARAWTRPPVAQWDQWTDDRVGHLFVVDLKGRVRSLSQGRGPPINTPALSRAPFDIAPDGRALAYAGDSDKSGVRPNLDVFLLDISAAAASPARNLTADNPQDDDEPLFSPKGANLAFVRQHIRGFYADRKRLMVADLAGGGVREIAPGWDRSAEGLVWAPDGRSLVGAIDDAGERAIYKIPLEGAPPQRLTRGADFRSLAIAGQGKELTLVALRDSFTEPATLVRVDPQTGAAVKISDFNDQALAAIKFGAVESVRFPGAGGAAVQMWVVKPPNFDPAKRYPLFLLLHGGPHNAITNSWTYRWNAQVFASWGYVAAWPNFHGSSGFGQAFADAINPNRADLPYADAIAAAAWFKAQPWIDPKRMVAGGGSYGGYLASVILGRPHPFQALVAHAPVYNTYTQIASDYGGEQDRFFEPWDAPADYLRYSPNMAAANFTTPTLVLHGQLDQRVPIAHSIELFHTLQRRGVASKLVTFSDEGHWVQGRSNSLYWYDSVREWIAAYAPPGGQ